MKTNKLGQVRNTEGLGFCFKHKTRHPIKKNNNSGYNRAMIIPAFFFFFYGKPDIMVMINSPGATGLRLLRNWVS